MTESEYYEPNDLEDEPIDIEGDDEEILAVITEAITNGILR
jgi:hypothetical protein